MHAADAMRFRRLARRVHLALGLVVGGIFVVASLSGALLIFAPEIEGAADPAPHRTPPGRDVGFGAVLGRVAERYPGRRVTMLRWPLQQPFYTATLARSGDEPPLQVRVDPGTGAILGAGDDGGTFFGWLTELHTSLLAGDIGRTLVSWSTVGAALLLVSGLYLWWPGPRRLATAFAVRGHKGPFLLTYDLHRVVGALSSIPLLVMALTGLVMAFPETAGRVIHAMVPGPGSPELPWTAPLLEPRERAPAAPGGPVSPADCLRIAHGLVPGAETFYLTFPEGPADPVQVRLQVGDEPRPFGMICRVFLDPVSGRALRVMDPRRSGAADRYVSHHNYPVHVGSIGGTPLRLAYLFATLCPAVLMSTGVAVWRRKRSKLGPERRSEAAVGSSSGP